MIWRFTRTLSYRLIAWSVLSLLVGAVLWFSANGFRHGLGLQAVLWGMIDAGIAFLGLRGLASKLIRAFDPLRAAEDTRKLRKLLWINTGLDLLYVLGGFSLAFTLGQSDEFLRGSGFGVVIQGAFLFLFDLLHALSIPSEARLPDSGLFSGPQHDPFDLPGERGGGGTILLVHGFPGTPVEMRALGETLQAAGWRVRGLLLPGFGKELPTLFQQRAAAWSAVIADEVRQARAEGSLVILAGFSMGAGLSIPAAAEAQPDGLVLVSPFWLDLNPLARGLIGLAGLFLPEHFNPFRWISPERIGASPAFSPPPGRLYPPAPEILHGMKDVQIPLVFLEQFVALSRRAKASAPLLEMPVLVIQGSQDRVVRPRLSRKMAGWIGPRARYLEIPGEHHIVMPDSPACARVCQEIAAFAESISNRP